MFLCLTCGALIPDAKFVGSTCERCGTELDDRLRDTFSSHTLSTGALACFSGLILSIRESGAEDGEVAPALLALVDRDQPALLEAHGALDAPSERTRALLAALGDASVPRLIPGPGGWRLETEPEAAAPSGGLFGLGLLIAAIALGYALVSLVKGGSGG